MSRLIQILMGLVLLAGLLQWGVPRLVDGIAARQLERYDHGPRPVVSVSAMPFWELVSGRFQNLSIVAKNGSFHSFHVRRVRFDWKNGRVSVAALSRGQLTVLSPGHVTMTVVLSANNLSAFIAKQGTIGHARVVISPHQVGLKGQIQLAGATVPLNTLGTLEESANHQMLVFHPTSIDGLKLPVLTNVQLVNVSSLNLPWHVTIQSVQLENNQLALTAGN